MKHGSGYRGSTASSPADRLAACQVLVFFFSSRRRHTRCSRDWSSDVCSSDLAGQADPIRVADAFLALHPAGTNPIFIVLKSAGDAEVRFRIVQSDPVKFSRRNADRKSVV